MVRFPPRSLGLQISWNRHRHTHTHRPSNPRCACVPILQLILLPILQLILLPFCCPFTAHSTAPSIAILLFSALKWFEKVQGSSLQFNHPEPVYRYPTHIVVLKGSVCHSTVHCHSAAHSTAILLPILQFILLLTAHTLLSLLKWFVKVVKPPGTSV